MKAISSKVVCKLLERHGWRLDRKTGSHPIDTKAAHPASIPVPVHGNKALKCRTLLGILKRAGLTKDDL